MFENYPSLLITKLYIPRPRSSHIRRESLLAALDAGLERKLILIAASAGSGKTTLLADWSSQQDAGWLSLDEGDNDSSRFLSYLLAAIQTRYPQVGQELLAALQSPQPPAAENVLHSLVNQLAALPERLILVLDDYHVIENQAIHAALSFLLDHLPPQVTLVILTRADPPLPLARLRARNDLLELRAADLRFSPEETSNFFKSLNLSSEAIRALETRTEGWIVGLQLASIALQALPGDKSAFINNFTGSHRFILDYLIEEVLSRQPENVRRFLLQTSILHRLNADLCSAVAGDGDAMIEYLEKNNLFLVPLDQSRHWYRYHHLFADLLRARLQVEYPAAINDLNQRAAKWHERNHLPEEAIVYALAAGDFEHAAELMTGPAVGVMRRGEIATLLDWYRAFPRDFVRSHPRLSLQFGLAFALNGRWDEAEILLNAVEDVGSRPEEALMLAYLVASYRQNAARLAEIARTAASARPDRITKLVLGMVVSLSGDLRQACQLLAESQEMSERAGDFSLALTALFHQCRYQVFLGNLHRAHDLSQAALERIRDLGNAAVPMALFAHVSLGRILIEWNDLENAVHHLSQAVRLAELSGFVTGMVSSATLMLAEVKQAQGDSESATQTAAQAIAYAERYDPLPEVTLLKTYQARISLAQGSTPADWMRESAHDQPAVSMFYPQTIVRVTRAHGLLNQRKIDEAIALLTGLAAESQNLLTVETLNLLALARQAQGDSVHALLMLEQALTLGEAENRVRAFLDLGSPMAKLLARFCESHPEHAYARKILTLFPAQSEMTTSVESLSERELDVLRLIVAGQSNDEIAQTLTLAVSTVKWYINTLYAKLHVKTRSQAIARTHELKLLSG